MQYWRARELHQVALTPLSVVVIVGSGLAVRVSPMYLSLVIAIALLLLPISLHWREGPDTTSVVPVTDEVEFAPLTRHRVVAWIMVPVLIGILALPLVDDRVPGLAVLLIGTAVPFLHWRRVVRYERRTGSDLLYRAQRQRFWRAMDMQLYSLEPELAPV